MKLAGDIIEAAVLGLSEWFDSEAARLLANLEHEAAGKPAELTKPIIQAFAARMAALRTKGIEELRASLDAHGKTRH